MFGQTHWVTGAARTGIARGFEGASKRGAGKRHPDGAGKRHADGAGKRWARLLPLAVLLGGALFASFGLTVAPALAASTPTVELGQASSYAALSGASVGNTVSAPGAPFTTLRGDLGVVANAQPTGFPPGVVTGQVNVGNEAATKAHADAGAAYTEVAKRTGGTALAGALAGVTISPGLHTITGAASNTTTVTLDGGGNSNAVFVFQVDGALTAAAGSDVALINGAKASNVFWQVNGAAEIGANADFAGTLIALNAVAVGAGSTLNGRAFALNGALTLNDDEVYSAPPVLTITGGASAYTNDTTPTISGTTDLEAPGVVTVTIAGQALTATPSGGAWSVTSAILANNVYPVLASVTDGAGNQGSATQQLTVDTVPPIITINGGPSLITNDTTPTIAGTSDVAPGTVVHVTVPPQTLTALVQPGGTWNVTPATLTDGSRTVTASVTDPAGNQSTTSQALRIDTVPPAVTITGGTNALTDDATPVISGTAAVAPGTTVTVTLADQTLTGFVGNSEAWSVTAAALSNGPHRVVMSVYDEAGNLATFTQTLTVDTVSPTVSINGGATAKTTKVDPTIAGTSNAAPGSTVTVSIAGQTMTTLLQANGTWNTTPSRVGDGTWPVLASAPDPAGNVGRAKQTLTILAGATSVTVGAGTTGAKGSKGATGSKGTPGSASRLSVTVSCAADHGARCKGLLSATSLVTSRRGKAKRITAAGAHASHKENKRPNHKKKAKSKKRPKNKTAVVLVASGSYSIAAGRRTTITLKLNKLGRKLLRRFHRVPATLKVTGAISATRRITFSSTKVRALP